MAETTQAEELQQGESADKVMVTNAHRNQPILFHVMGGSVRLGPFETRVLDRSCLASPELSELLLTGALRVRPAAEPEASGGEKSGLLEDPTAAAAPATPEEKASDPVEEPAESIEHDASPSDRPA